MAFRFTRINCIVILLLLYAGCVSSRNSDKNKSSKNKNQNNAQFQLFVNIGENPFLKNQSSTVVFNNTFLSNPFLNIPTNNNASLPSIQWFGNGSEQISHSGVNPFLATEDNQVHIGIGIYANNPFLRPTDASSNKNDIFNIPNTSDNKDKPIVFELPNTPRPTLTIGSINNNAEYVPHENRSPTLNTPSPIYHDSVPNENTASSILNIPVRISTRTKSDIKCEEYNREILGRVQTTSLVGTGSGVIEINNNNCGRTNPLVTGGVDATPGEFPHMVALGRQSANGAFTFICGGTLISKSWVLSAAHCTYGPDGGPTVVRIGFYNLQNESSGTMSSIRRIIRHSSYKPPAMYADIALLELEAVVTFDRSTRPACLYQQYDNVPTQAWVSGWGVTEFGGEHNSDKLQKALLDIIDNVACTIRYNSSIAVPHGVSPSMICAGDPRGGWKRDACSGDSGGPLQVVHPRSLCLFQIIGVTSFGEGCAIIDKPGVYIRVSHYLNWIEDIVWPDE